MYHAAGIVGTSSLTSMDQAELNTTVQRWLESLLHPVEGEDQVAESDAIPTGSSQDLSAVLQRLRQVMKLEEAPKTSLRAGGTHLAVLARSLAAYLHVALEPKDLDRLARTVTRQTTLWLKAVFKLSGRDLTPYYHDDPKEGLARVFRMALCKKYEKYTVDGLNALYLKPPVIYISDSGQALDCFHTCSKLGLPMSSISFVSCNTVFGSPHTMDVSALEKAINDDLTEGKLPTLVIAYAGTPLAGHVENLTRLREICSQNGMWLHVQGHALSSLCLPVEETEVAVAREADSLTLCPGIWFGLLSCPLVTVHRAPLVVETEKIPNAKNFPPKDTEVAEGSILIPQVSWVGMETHGLSRLLPLTLWLCLQYLGTTTLMETVTYCSNLTQHLISKLEEVPGVRRFDVPNHRPYVVLFKYYGGGEVEMPEPFPEQLLANQRDTETSVSTEGVEHEGEEGGGGGGEEESTAAQSQEQPLPPSEEPPHEAEEPPSGNTESQPPSTSEGAELPPSRIVVGELPLPTANMANMMIAKETYQLFSKVGVSTLKLPKEGVCFKFDPIISFPEHSTSIEDVDKFVAAFKQKVVSLHPTALARCLIESTLKGQPNLRCLEFPSFFATGFIQYVPTDWAGKTELTLEEVNRLNKLNLELASDLSHKNSAYTPFQHGNFTCIMIKELPEGSSLQDFISELLEETKKFEENKKFLEGMSEKIRKGIEAAEAARIKEKEKKEQEEGILRYLPVVGSVLNWFSPPTPTTPEGRTFSLTSGKVEPTTSTYKYKMQLDDTPEKPGDPQPASQQEEEGMTESAAQTEESGESKEEEEEEEREEPEESKEEEEGEEPEESKEEEENRQD